MTDKDYKKLHEFAYVSGGWTPYNQNALDLQDQTVEGEVIAFKEVTARDVAFHRCYFSLLNYVYSWMPDAFKAKVSRDIFYLWLKHLRGEYEVAFEFKDGMKLIEYQSISFSRMGQKEFEDYVREQLPFIYENVIGAYYKGEQYDNILENTEHEFEKFLAKL